MDEYDKKTTMKIVKYIGLAFVILFVVILFFGSFTFVGAGQVGVVTRFGAVNRVAYPGMVLKIPLVEHIEVLDTRTQKDQVNADSASKDLQTVKATIAVNYHLEGSKAVSVYQNIGSDYQDKVIAPAIQNIFKQTTAKFTAEELITRRDEVRLAAEADLKTQLANYNVQVENFNIVNFDFSPDFDQAIERKQVANQEVETAKQKLAKAKVDADTAVAEATGQADAQAALKNTGALSPEYLQFLAVQKWNGILPTVVGGSVPFVNIPTK